MKRILFLLIMLITINAVFGANIEIAEMREATWAERFFGGMFAISTDKSAYEVGETVEITDVQNIDAECAELRVNIEVKYDNGNSIFYQNRPVAYNTYPFNAFLRVRIDSKSLEPGIYKIQTDWICDNLLVGKDGRLDSNEQPDIKTFEIVKNNIFTNPDQECAKNCQVGQKLILPDSPDCYCVYTYTANNGECELGEPSTETDCQTTPVIYNGGGSGGEIQINIMFIIAGIVVLLLLFLLLSRKK